jgi:hypothetical protein
MVEGAAKKLSLRAMTILSFCFGFLSYVQRGLALIAAAQRRKLLFGPARTEGLKEKNTNYTGIHYKDHD